MRRLRPQLKLNLMAKHEAGKLAIQFKGGECQVIQALAKDPAVGQTFRVKPQGYKKFITVVCIEHVHADGDPGEAAYKRRIYVVQPCLFGGTDGEKK